MSTMIDEDTNMISSLPYEYEDGEEMKQIWHPEFIFFAYLIAIVSSYSAVHLLDHGLWRSDDLKKVAIIKNPDIVAACMLGFGTVWCMHFIGMAAVTLEGTPICYDWLITLGSLVAVVVLMIAGIKVAGNDIFATPDRVKLLEDIVGNNYVTEREARWSIFWVTSFHKLQFLAAGSFLAASGAIVMHYTGMMAQRGPFRMQWNVGFIAASSVIAIIICFVGFWIIFRMRWKIKQASLRLASAAIIALAVCGLHFFGMLSVTYYADSDSSGVCQRTWDQHNASPSSWTDFQIIVLVVGMFIPMLSLFISNIMNQELILAYEGAAHSKAIVSSLFPTQIRDKMLADDKKKLRNFLSKDPETTENSDDLLASKPIADLFPETTIMFADIAGFTSWSSEREPSQVFMLLETLYQAFDEISKRHGVFKVETVGDCYVAVSGLPDPRPDHAVVMGSVARDCVYKTGILTRRLEEVLGPDTGELNIRIGLHSGPVTAGVLRGERARFQLFGDTMNLASRMESTGMPGRVHISSETYALLKAAGKDKWVTARDADVFVKGKGNLTTYWLNGKGTFPGSQVSSTDKNSSVVDDIYQLTSDKTSRLIAWNVDLLQNILKQIVARRNVCTGKRKPTPVFVNEKIIRLEAGKTFIDEVCEIIELPEFEKGISRRQEDPESIELPKKVAMQLTEYVTCIVRLYKSNPFHNFEHASHVALSVTKLLSRIVAHSSDLIDGEGKCVASTLHDHTYGITSDPLTQFACVLSALIHDVDHQGVPNTTLALENARVAQVYKNKSIAEQNSIDIAWDLLMDDYYKELRSTIYRTDVEMQRFRQLVVNTVMATDIMDKDLKNLRNDRWERAFCVKEINEDPHVTINRKATIVIEHLIQASDVAHTMQHWHVYRKWNQRLFEEMYKAYKEGRSDVDPSENWYKGEIGFFDFYIIPLAKKLKDCGVFGVASDEYLNYAVQNRQQWETHGREIVNELKESVKNVWASIQELPGEDSGLE